MEPKDISGSQKLAKLLEWEFRKLEEWLTENKTWEHTTAREALRKLGMPEKIETWYEVSIAAGVLHRALMNYPDYPGAEFSPPGDGQQI